jgi:hypothetical protein
VAGVLAAVVADVGAQAPAPAPVIQEKGPHHRVWEQVEPRLLPQIRLQVRLVAYNEAWILAGYGRATALLLLAAGSKPNRN